MYKYDTNSIEKQDATYKKNCLEYFLENSDESHFTNAPGQAVPD